MTNAHGSSVSEGDQFVWLGYDLRKAPGTDRYDYGYLPPRLLNDVLKAFWAWREARKATVSPR